MRIRCNIIVMSHIIVMSLGYLMSLWASPRPEKGDYAHYYDYVAEDIIWYSVPAFAKIKQVKFFETCRGIFEIWVEMHCEIPTKIKDRLSVAAYFDTPADYSWDTGVIFAMGEYPFSIKPPSPIGGIFLTHKNRWIGKVTSEIRGAFIIMRFKSKLVSNSKNLQMVVVRYLPANVDLKRVAGGLESCIVDVKRLDPKLKNVSIGIPGHP